MSLKSRIRAIPDFPKQGIVFRDITTLLKDATGFRIAIQKLVNRYSGRKIQKVVAIESRGFIIGSPLAFALGAGFVPIRKKGKLPSKTIGQEYESEYGIDALEIHEDAIEPGERILLVDDVLATGGTAHAACVLVNKLGGDIIENAFLIELSALEGREYLESRGVKVFSLEKFTDG